MKQFRNNTSVTLFFAFFFLALLYYADGFKHFFYQDDLFHFHISQVTSWRDSVDFFNPNNKFGYQIYRPLGTQVVFGAMQALFGINHTAFHLFILTLLALNTTLIYQLLRKVTTPLPSMLLSIFYLAHHQNIGIVYFLSTVQLSLALLLTLISLHLLYHQKPGWLWHIFLLYGATILSQEIAMLNVVIFPLLLWVKNPKQIKHHWKWILNFWSLTFLYLGIRWYFINHRIFTENTHYVISLNPKDMLENLAWYSLWFLSVPEYVINFVGSGLKPLPPLFTTYARETWTSLLVFGSSMGALVTLAVIGLKRSKPILLPLAGFVVAFVLSLAPVLVFPWHKYVYHLPIASVFGLLAIAQLIGTTQRDKRHQSVIIGCLGVLLLGAITTNFIDRRHSYNYQRGFIAASFKDTVDWDGLRAGAHTILVKNDPSFKDFSPDWGNTSTQAKIILKEDLFFKLLSNNPNLEVFYEDDLESASLETMSFDYTIVAKANWK